VRERCWIVAVALVVAYVVACGSQSSSEPVGSVSAAIVGGSEASAFPEAVVVTSSGFLPCSGVVLAPRVVLTAGHCKSPTLEYSVLAPNAGGQQVTGSRDWTTYTGDPATSSDTLLIFLDAPIALASYPVLASTAVAPGTSVVDVGRTLNGTITMQDYVSPAVTIMGPATALGFPYNYEATPDISQEGDSGGPIELPGTSPHTVVAIVDTDTVEQNISEASPIDMFARLDVVRNAILAQIAGEEAGVGAVDASDDAAGVSDARSGSSSSSDASRVPPHDATVPARDAGETKPGASSSACAFGVARSDDSGVLLAAIAVALTSTSRRRRRARDAGPLPAPH